MTPDTTDIPSLAARARAASRVVATLDTTAKNDLLGALADAIDGRRHTIRQANDADLAAARAAQLPAPKVQRLVLDDSGLTQMCEGLAQIARLPDPIGKATKDYTVPTGLHVRKIRAPLGVIAMIYEARPGVTIDAFSLCFKAGNACILKGGREAARSNEALATVAWETLERLGIPRDTLTLFTISDREQVKRLLQQDRSIDLVIPRGGEALIRFVHEHSHIPTVQHFHGVCHVYVDRDADLDSALEICVSAKVSAPATCNALECVLVHTDIAETFVPRLAAQCAAAGVELRATSRARSFAPDTTLATDDDFGQEYLDLVLALDVVDDCHDAIGHISRHGSNHTDVIVTENGSTAETFVARVQSSCVLVNASTRFNDGFQLGLGAEIGISTSRIHAYGPMGLEELTTQRYVVHGSRPDALTPVLRSPSISPRVKLGRVNSQ